MYKLMLYTVIDSISHLTTTSQYETLEFHCNVTC